MVENTVRDWHPGPAAGSTLRVEVDILGAVSMEHEKVTESIKVRTD